MRPSLILPVMLLTSAVACGQLNPPPAPPRDRLRSLEPGATKVTPETDLHPPKSLTSEYQDLVPLPAAINTAGAEDSAFILPDGNTLYFFFTPNPSIPAERQLLDGVTGIYVSHRQAAGWSDAQRVVLQDPNKLSLDGCEFVFGDEMWFCSARQGYTGLHWFTAQWRADRWQNWQNADFDPAYDVGELHISSDGSQLYFHSSRPSGQGGYDIWVSDNVGGQWQPPVNLHVVNSPQSDGWPFVTQDGRQLWFTRILGGPELWRSIRTNGLWGPPERMFAPLAGEASLDNAGNVYFTHHFYSADRMLEADIYVAHPNP